MMHFLNNSFPVVLYIIRPSAKLWTIHIFNVDIILISLFIWRRKRSYSNIDIITIYLYIRAERNAAFITSWLKTASFTKRYEYLKFILLYNSHSYPYFNVMYFLSHCMPTENKTFFFLPIHQLILENDISNLLVVLKTT